MTEEPRIPMRWVKRENGNEILQVFIPAKNETINNTMHHYSAMGWVDVPEFVERIEPA